MKKCPYCTAEIEDNASFCIYCMESLTDKQKITPEANVRKNGWLIISLAAPFILLCIAAAVYFGLNSSDAKDEIRNPKKSGKGYSVSNDDEIPTIGQGTGLPEAGNSETTPAPTIGEAGGSGGSSGGTTSGPANPSTGSGGTTSGPATPQTGSGGSSGSGGSGSSSGGTDVVEPTPPSSGGNSGNEIPPVPPQTWETKEVEGGVEITGILNENANGVYSIPSEIDGKKVVGIGMYAFYYETEIASITLPETLQYIGDQAFAYCYGITEIHIPKSVTKIGVNAFINCKKLSTVYIASPSADINIYAFSSSYQRDVPLTIYAPKTTLNSTEAGLYWDATYVEWNG